MPTFVHFRGAAGGRSQRGETTFVSTPRWPACPSSPTATRSTPPAEDLSLGVELTVRRVAGNNRWVVIGVRAAKADNTP